jgi:hypothetical protein
MVTLYSLDRFIIRKGEGIYNLFDFINAAMGSESYNATKAGLIDSHHDITHGEITGVEGDAAELAYNKGFGNPAMAEKYHAGPSGPNDAEYMAAFRHMVFAGAGKINDLVERQNQINMSRGIRPMNMPFIVNSIGEYTVDPSWGHKAHTYSLNDVKSKDGVVNPFDKMTGELITNIKSSRTEKGEGYLRPYAEAYEESKSQDGGPKAGKHRKRTSFIISPATIHRDVISINDGDIGVSLFNTIKSAQRTAEQTGADPVQAAYDALRKNKKFANRAGGIHHRDFATTFGRYSENSLNQFAQEQGLEQEIPAASTSTNQIQDMTHFMEPSHLDKNWFRNFGNGGVNGHYMREGGSGRKAAIKDLAEHGLTEQHVNNIYDTTIEMFGRGTFRNDRGRKATLKQLFVHNLANHHMQDGQPPSWVTGQMAMPRNPSEAKMTPSAMPEPEKPKEQEKTPEEMPPPMPNPLAVKPLDLPRPDAPSVVATPPPKAPVAPPPVVNSLGRVTPAPSRRGFMDMLGSALGNMYGNFTMGKSAGEKEMVETYLERVQLDLAKTEIVGSKAKLNPQSTFDISLMAGQINKSSSEVVAIINSRGDWRKIAKSFNVPHEEVQKLKVIFNE